MVPQKTYRLLKKIEENEETSLPVNSLFSVNADKTHLDLDSGGTIDIAFLIRSGFIAEVTPETFPVGSRIVTTDHFDDSHIRYGTVRGIMVVSESDRRYYTSFVEAPIGSKCVRKPTKEEAKMFFA